MSDSVCLRDKGEVTRRLGICDRTLEKLVRAGKFPPGLKLGKQVVWADSVVEKWLSSALEAQVNWAPPQRARKPSKTA